MSKIFRNFLPYWKSVILVLLLLFVQAWCDLSLPQYTSDIIDVGIQNSGVSSILPQEITKEEYEQAQIFMTEKEQKKWTEYYTKDGANYVCKKLSQQETEDAEKLLDMALIMNYQMSAMEESAFKEAIAKQSGQDASALASVSVEQIGQQMGVELKPFQQEKEDKDGNTVEATCVDVRPLYAAMLQNGMMKQEDLLSVRDTMEEKLEEVGSTMMHSIGVAYAVQCDKAAGVDVDELQTSYLWTEGLKMVGIALLMGAVTVCVGLLASRVGAGVGRDLRKNMFGKVVRFSNAEMDRYSTASLITRTTNDVQQIQLVSVLLLRMLLYAPILGIGGVIKVYKTGAHMEWVIGLAVLVILGIVGVLMQFAMPKFKLMQKLVDALNLVAREILTGISVIRAFGRQKKEEERFEKANRDLTKTMLFTNRVMTFMMPCMMLVMYCLSIGIIWVGSHKIDEGVLQVGAMTAFLTYAMQIVMSFLMLTMMSIMLPRAAVAANRIDEVLKTQGTIHEKDQPEMLSKKEGSICFSHVNFRYPGAEQNALEDIDFTAKAGETTAIIGSTGCGKSTLIHLIPRLYDATDGSITLDGVDIRNLALHDLRGQIGFVPQKAVLFSGDIASNLRFGNPDATEEEMMQAAEIAQATEFIEEKPDRYHSAIAQGGTNVSGGQKQRLAIARAIAKKPKIFIFDDSFSALDLKTDAALRKALNEKVTDATVLIVAQRVSTILHADQILVLDEGRIVGKGTHEELMKDCEVYQQIARSQLSAKELGEEGKEENHE